MMENMQPTSKKKFQVGPHLKWALWVGVLVGLAGLFMFQDAGAAGAAAILGGSFGWYVMPDIYQYLTERVELPRWSMRLLPVRGQSVERTPPVVEEDTYVGESDLDPLDSYRVPQNPNQTTLLADPLPDMAQESLAQVDEDDLFSNLIPKKEPPFVRLTQAEVLAKSKWNDFSIWLGQSVKKEPRYVKRINWRKRHYKCIGTTQYGKSTFVAYFLDTIFKTHDTDHAQVAILDAENRTGQLFEDDPHVAEILKNGRPLKLHARTEDEVFEMLGYIYTIIMERYKLSMEECEKLPTLWVYFEEFLAYKDALKNAQYVGTPEQMDVARRKYLTFMNRFKKIAQQGLKVYVQLLICAQVEYADEDLRDALANVAHGFAFCVRPTAAKAAGFFNNDLLTANAIAQLQGQCVVQTNEVSDIVLVPEYDIVALLLEKQKRQVKKTSFLVEINEYGELSTASTLPAYDQEDEGDLLDRALTAWDEGYQTQPALANELGISPWKVRSVYAEVKRLRPNMQEVPS